MVATTPTRPEFIDTYWIIPEYEATPYGKVSPHLISPLRNNPTLAYSLNQHLKKTGAGFGIPSTEADINRPLKVRFFYVRNQRYALQWWDVTVGPKGPLVSFCTSIPTPLRLASPLGIGLVRLQNLTEEAATMATTHARPEFIDTYWIIPEYETTPYGKESPHLISPLRNNPTLAYSLNQHLKKTGAGLGSPSEEADITGRFSAVFLHLKSALYPTMVGCNGGAERLAGFLLHQSSHPDTSRHHVGKHGRGSEELEEEAATMATTHARPEFIDTYWIIPEYETTPYGKVSPHLISPLRNNPTLAYSLNQHLKKTGAGFTSLSEEADITGRFSAVFLRPKSALRPTMVGCNGGAERPAGFLLHQSCNSVTSRLPDYKRGSRFIESEEEATTMATTHARAKFTDTYWIIPLDSDAPYGKVSFTRQDRRTFIAMFKDSRLIWAGRQPVRTGMEAH